MEMTPDSAYHRHDAVKLLLVQPPIEDFYDTDVRLQPIGLAYLKAAVRKHLAGVDVTIVDFHRGWGRRKLPLPQELDYLRCYYPHPDRSPFGTFHHYYRFGASAAEMRRVIGSGDYDLVGISSLFTAYHRQALEVAALVKEVSRAQVLVGGSHVSSDPRSVLESSAVDFVIQAEGEKALVDFLRARLRSPGDPEAWGQVPGLGYKRNGSAFLNAPGSNYRLEELPPPDFTDLPLKRYRFKGKPMTFLITSRGCPHRCSFCAVHATFGRHYRRRPVERVLDEMRLRYGQGYRVFDFEDDNLTFYREEMKELCRAIRQEFRHQDIELVAMNGISYLSLDAETLRLMREAGFTHLNLSLVSSDETVLESTKRPHTVAKYLEVVDEAHRLGFRITSYQILGLPVETLDSMIQTLCFAARLPVLIGPSPFYLPPGSAIEKMLGAEPSEEGYFKARLTALAWEGRDFTRDDVYTLLVISRIINFLKSCADRGEGETSAGAILAARHTEESARRRLGLEILHKLLHTGILFAALGEELRPLERFRSELFFQIWTRLGHLSTPGGRRIRIESRAKV